MDEVQDNGKTTEGVATTATITAMLTTITGAEDLTGGDTTPRATEVATTITTRSLVTTRQATAIRDMGQGQVAGKLGEAEVVLLPIAADSKPKSVAVDKGMKLLSWMLRAGRGRGRGRAAGRGPLQYPDPEDIKFLKVMKGHTKKVAAITINPEAQQVLV